jgi:hypothetical protein
MARGRDHVRECAPTSPDHRVWTREDRILASTGRLLRRPSPRLVHVRARGRFPDRHRRTRAHVEEHRFGDLPRRRGTPAEIATSPRYLCADDAGRSGCLCLDADLDLAHLGGVDRRHRGQRLRPIRERDEGRSGRRIPGGVVGCDRKGRSRLTGEPGNGGARPPRELPQRRRPTVMPPWVGELSGISVMTRFRVRRTWWLT